MSEPRVTMSPEHRLAVITRMIAEKEELFRFESEQTLAHINTPPWPYRPSAKISDANIVATCAAGSARRAAALAHEIAVLRSVIP